MVVQYQRLDLSNVKRKTQTQVTKRSREEIENVSLNGNVDVRSSRSGGSKFEARVRNPSKLGDSNSSVHLKHF